MDLDTILSPGSVAAFLDEYFGRDVLHIAGPPEKFSRLIPRQAIDAMAADSVAENVDQVYEPVAILSQNLARSLEAPIRANLHSGGFALHRCLRDTIILQIAGQSDCKVHGDNEEPANPPAWAGFLSTGDALYIPRGWWRQAAPSDQPAVQLRFAIENPTGADLVGWLFEKVKEQENFRKDIPRFADPTTKADYVTGLTKLLVRFLRVPALLERHRRDVNMKAPAQPSPASLFRADVSDQQLIVILTPRPMRIRRADHETVLLLSMGKRLTFPLDSAALLYHLCDHAPVSIADFRKSFEGEFARDEVSDFLSLLSGEGIIGLRDPDSI